MSEPETFPVRDGVDIDKVHRREQGVDAQLTRAAQWQMMLARAGKHSVARDLPLARNQQQTTH